jgi:DNA-binding LacI/PurR family transcriptional regulator
MSRHIAGVLARTAELNLMAEQHVMETGSSPASLARILHARGTDGVIFYISGPVFSWDFPWENFACVTLGFDGEAHRLHAVTSDWFAAVRRAVARCEAAGKKRLGFVSFFRGNPSIDGRTHAAMLLEREQLAAKLGPQPPVHLYPADGNLQKNIYQTEKAAFLKWFEKHRPDVVLDGNNFGYWWLRDAGYQMPQNVSYVSLNSDPDVGVNCSGILHLRERQGRMAVDLLFSLIQMNERGMSSHPMRLTCECDWIDGGTLGGLAAAEKEASRRRPAKVINAQSRKVRSPQPTKKRR